MIPFQRFGFHKAGDSINSDSIKRSPLYILHPRNITCIWLHVTMDPSFSSYPSSFRQSLKERITLAQSLSAGLKDSMTCICTGVLVCNIQCAIFTCHTTCRDCRHQPSALWNNATLCNKLCGGVFSKRTARTHKSQHSDWWRHFRRWLGLVTRRSWASSAKGSNV